VSAPSGADPRPYFVFYRLVGTGWLMEFRDRYRKIVDMNSNARLLLAALLDIQAGRLVSYGGEVLQVLRTPLRRAGHRLDRASPWKTYAGSSEAGAR